jgi:hypothetical protein
MFVGRAPWPADDPLVGLLEHRKSRTRGSGADGGVRPTFGRANNRTAGKVVPALLFAQGGDGVDAGGAARGQVAGQHRQGGQ